MEGRGLLLHAGMGSSMSSGRSSPAGTRAGTSPPVPAPTYNLNTISNSKAPFNQIGHFGPGTLFGDPIDMVHGNFLYEHQDIKTGYGEGAGALRFRRFYSSGMSGQTGPLGRGWTHNYDMSIRTASDGFLGLATGSHSTRSVRSWSTGPRWIC